ncbi:hypothetical protein AX289_12180 [Methylorubrum populi]|nr:hypothetical protein AX289_12180 [Methylorubrum populi]
MLCIASAFQSRYHLDAQLFCTFKDFTTDFIIPFVDAEMAQHRVHDFTVQNVGKALCYLQDQLIVPVLGR